MHGIAVRADAPWATFEAFVADAKGRPGKLTYGTFGQASIQNLVMVDLQQRLGIDHLHANTLDVRDGVVTGEVRTPIVDGAMKAQRLSEIAVAEGLSLEQCIAVGDGANDLPMMGVAGLSVAYHAKPKVREQARIAINDGGLDRLLTLLR